MKLILALCLVLLCAVAFVVAGKSDHKFENFRVRYIKNYRDNNTQTYRKNIFLENMAKIDELNDASDTAEFGVTEFTDLTPEEFASTYLMRNEEVEYPDPPEDSVRAARAQTPRNTDAAPASFDWRSRNALTPVKNQQSCGSCWAFSVVEEVETANFLAGKTLTQLSPQQVVDCDTSNWACGGGWPSTAYAYIVKAGGLQTNAKYPYTSRAGSCKFSKSLISQKITSWTWSSKTGAIDETKMMNDLYTYGPLSVCLSAQNFGYYTGGIFAGPSGSSIDHCVQLVGYGTQNGVNYWTIKNQWGASWGEAGYMRIKRGVNQNLIGTYATRAIY